jgi:peptide/nickel transport system ATP-binding protein
MSENKKTPLLQVADLKKHFPVGKHVLVKAVDGVTFHLHEGECLGLVGESGSGKTTVGRSILRAIKPTSGQAFFRIDGKVTDIANARHSQLKELRRHMQMIFQDPYSSLNPRMTILDIVGEPLLVNGMRDRREREARVSDLLVKVGLKREYLRRYPHAFSGGQRQRIGIARALALNPKFIVADEPVSALDVSVQAQILNLLSDLQEELDLTYLFIAHDLSVVRHICDRVAVMYVGKLVETADTDSLFLAPRHPYTEALLSAVPVPDPRKKTKRIILQGEVADPGNPPPGCVFHPRCRYAQVICRKEEPDLVEVGEGRHSRCHFAGELVLSQM